MRLRLWEVLAASIGVLFAGVFLLSNVSAIGYGLVGADALWLLTRVRIVERPSKAGRYARLQGQLGLAKVLVLLGIYAAVGYGIVIAHQDHAERTRPGLIGEFALAGMAFLLLEELKRSGDDALNWLLGFRAEHKVGEQLDRFADRGYLVMHGHKKDWGGDIDHLVCGPTGGYVVETKSYGFRRRDLGQAAANAAWLKEKLGVRWITAVLCVEGDLTPTRHGVVWALGHEQLVPWLEQQRNSAVDPHAARAVLLTAYRRPQRRRLVVLLARGLRRSA
jgi:hypothetical protein